MENMKKFEPQLGDVKEEKKFAYFPTIVGKETIWLRDYVVVYEWKFFGYLLLGAGGGRVGHGWAEISRHLPKD